MADGRYERQLVNALDTHGWAVLRAPSSGSSTERELPDVLALRRDDTVARSHGGHAGDDTAATVRAEALAVEAKTTSSTTAYAKADEVAALRSFADRAGARPALAAKFKRPGGDRSPFYLVDPADCRMTDSGNYGVPESDAADRAFAVVYAATRTKSARVEGL